jgi:hypothetical protein
VCGIDSPDDDDNEEILFGWHPAKSDEQGARNASKAKRHTSVCSNSQVDSHNKVFSSITNVCTVRARLAIKVWLLVRMRTAETRTAQAPRARARGARIKWSRARIKSSQATTKVMAVSTINGQLGNASTAKRCTSVCSNSNGATANDGKNFPHRPQQVLQ